MAHTSTIFCPHLSLSLNYHDITHVGQKNKEIVPILGPGKRVVLFNSGSLKSILIIIQVQFIRSRNYTKAAVPFETTFADPLSYFKFYA